MSFFFISILLMVSICDVILEDLERPSRVVGGEPVDSEDIPWQVSLQKQFEKGEEKYHFCGGSLIRDFWVLTAAHCTVDIDYSGVDVVIGASNLNSSDAAVFKVRKVFVNEDFDEATFRNDLALLQLSRRRDNKELDLEEKKAAAINLEKTPEREGENCLISGWGMLSDGGEMPDVLQKGEVNLQSDAECSSALSPRSRMPIAETNVCAGGGEVDTCQGDSGGPLVCCEDSSSPDVASCRLVGVTSWGIGCATPGLPGIYTEVAHYVRWIDDVIRRNTNSG